MAEDEEAARPPSIIFQNDDRSVVLIDVPRSIEEAQLPSLKVKAANGSRKRLVSSKPLDKPFKTPEPKNGGGGLTDSLSDLMSAAAATEALAILHKSHPGPWCLPRVVIPARDDEQEGNGSQKRKRDGPGDAGGILDSGTKPAEVLTPEDSACLQGTISSERDRFLAEAPQFDLVVLDPPWPNRSARRKKGSYHVADSLGSLRETLSLIPVAARLAPDGLVAVWITNKAGIVELLAGPRGLFAEWGLEQVGEWTWLKVTTSGEPIVDTSSTWRKPWERILLARRRGSERKLSCRGRVIISVPDLHSRKPNLRGLFEDVFPPGYRGLEVFARNLTADWWSWGDEALKFQQPEHWIEEP